MKTHRRNIADWGLWQPGAALMRRLRFPGKIGVISVAFLVPMSILFGMLVAYELSGIRAVDHERTGVRFVKLLLPAINQAGVWRQQSRDTAFGEGGEQLAQARQAFDANWAQIQALQTELGAQVRSDIAFAAVQQAVDTARSVQPVPGQPADPEVVYNGMIGVARTLTDLLVAVADGSGLNAVPDLGTAYMVEAVIKRVPENIRINAEIRGLVRSALKKGEITPANAARLQGLQTLLDHEIAQTRHALDRAAELLPPEQGKAISRKAGGSVKAVIEFVRKEVPAGASSLTGDVGVFIQLANKAMDDQFSQVATNLDLLDTLLAQRKQALVQEMVWAVAISGVFLLLAAYLFMGFFSAMSQSFHALREGLISISMGDLRTAIVVQGRDEVAGMLKEMGKMQVGLAITVRQVQEAAESVVSGSSEIAQGTQALAGRTESAAAALEQSSAALEQTNATVAMTADSVRQASAIAVENANTAGQGGSVMQEVADTMGRIQGASQRISDIIQVIDGIAFQTNILALNAAVEAARAGEQGRGFAVVASEVRALAGRSAVAAKEIKQLISSSTQEVDKGSAIVTAASDHMHQIVANAENLMRLLSEVANGAREQSQGIAQIGAAVNELDRNTQANAALVEQTAVSADTLNAAAVRMAAQVDEFRLPGERITHTVEGVNVDAFIDGHREWKMTLRQAIETRQTVDAAKLGRDDCCSMGQWIYGDGQRLRGRNSFTALIDSHAQFHQEAARVGDMINGRQFEQAIEALAPGTPFSQATSEVVTALSAAKRLGFR